MKTQRAERLRTTVDFLPPETKRAMLDGLERNRIITGANTDRRGGMCPMIAADRNAFQSGPMADIFAAVWDSYNGACILNRRDASERDLRTLKTMLETSLANSPQFSSELGQAWLDYHLETGPEAAGPGIDFGQELTAALESSEPEAGSVDAVSPAAPSSAPAPAPTAAPRQRRIELVYDGGPLPRVPAAAPADPIAAARPARPETTPVPMNSTYEPYAVAAPKRRVPLTPRSVDAPPQTRAARHAALTTESADRARARAVIANQAATLKSREWPRSAAQPAAPVDATRSHAPATPLEAPAIRQAAIPQLRTAAPAPAGGTQADLGRGRAHEHSEQSAEGRTGWSWLPPMRSYDDHDDAGAQSTGGLPAGPTSPAPEVQPSEDQRSSIRI
ncbi:MAG TPA: hypothetical protein VHW26_02015 [Solirubrobacteraceae bacterium]|jgi:hypothetical protein|nr:hypothetical protein [Solirubrobacteraceae bacterium]